VSVADGVQVVSTGKSISCQDLISTQVHLVDSGSEVYVWIGKTSPLEDRKVAMATASTYLKDAARPAWTPISRLIETGETPVFKNIFSKWDRVGAEPARPTKTVPQVGASVAKVVAEEKVDVTSLYTRKREAQHMVDDGTGALQVWRVENFKKVEVPKEQYGQFYSGDSYVMLYTYKKGTRPQYIIYFWQGRFSSADEKGASALLAKDLDDEMHGEPTQVRVTQGKEPDHFCLLFRGRMVVHAGGVDSAFKKAGTSVAKAEPSEESSGQMAAAAAAAGDEARPSLYHVRGTTPLNTRAIQVDAQAASLNSGDSFVLNLGSQQYVWYGKYATSDEKATAKTVASMLAQPPSLVEMEEGQEPQEFWEALGGVGEYTSVQPVDDAPFDPRLLHCTNASGSFKIEEVFNFSQEDLISDDIMILDVFTEVYVWVGKDSNKAEKDMAFRAALDYVANAPDGRDKDTPIYRLEEGNEPRSFTACFIDWKEQEASFEDPYQKRLAQLKAAKGADASAAAAAASGAPAAAAAASDSKAPPLMSRVSILDIGFADAKSVSYTMAQLQDKANPPANIDVLKKELYLSDAEFQAVFKMNKADFAKLQGWKQQQEKKKVNLF